MFEEDEDEDLLDLDKKCKDQPHFKNEKQKNSVGINKSALK